MIVTNPTKNKISVLINGTTYSLEPEETKSGIPEADARHWQEQTHKFIILRKEKVKVEEPIVVTPPAPSAAATSELKENDIDEDNEDEGEEDGIDLESNKEE
jgi:hypothetical protein